ncbi:NADP-dependent oxidoreductase [Afipia sp. TerB]
MNRRIVLQNRPQGEPAASDFRLEQTAIPVVPTGCVLLRTRLLSLDPYMRWRMNAGASYAKPVELGDPMVGATVAEIVDSKHDKFSVGDIVLGRNGWQDYAVSDGSDLRKLDPEIAPVSTSLGVLGSPGLTAYTGLLNIGQPKAGETVVVAAATGPVGSLVGQIAKIKECRVIGIAGGADKCSYASEILGFDVALDHYEGDLAGRLRQACPQGIDVYFENVGGKIWDAVFPLLNDFARIPVCGLISQYNMGTGQPGQPGVDEFMRAMLVKRLTMRGFIVTDFIAQYGDFLRDVGGWLKAERIVHREQIVEGLESAPEAFIGMLKGRNFGKLIVRVS